MDIRLKANLTKEQNVRTSYYSDHTKDVFQDAIESYSISSVILACAFWGGEKKNPTVTFCINPGTASISLHCNLVNRKGIQFSKHHTCSRLLLGITQFTGKTLPTYIKSFHSSQFFLIPRSLPSPQAPCSYLGNLSLFVLSRPFWTTFSLLIQAICSQGR